MNNTCGEDIYETLYCDIYGGTDNPLYDKIGQIMILLYCLISSGLCYKFIKMALAKIKMVRDPNLNY